MRDAAPTVGLVIQDLTIPTEVKASLPGQALAGEPMRIALRYLTPEAIHKLTDRLRENMIMEMERQQKPQVTTDDEPWLPR
jgi:hypothetical protein